MDLHLKDKKLVQLQHSFLECEQDTTLHHALESALSETHYKKIKAFLKQDKFFPTKGSALDMELAEMMENSSELMDGVSDMTQVLEESIK